MASAPAAAVADIAARCATDSCAAVRLGPGSRTLWVTASFARAFRIQLEAPGLGAAGAALTAAAALS